MYVSGTAHTLSPASGPSAPTAVTVSFAVGGGLFDGTTAGGGVEHAVARRTAARHFTSRLRMAVTWHRLSVHEGQNG